MLGIVYDLSPVEALASAVATEAEAAVANLPRVLAGRDVMVTVLLARNRLRPTRSTVVAALAAELLTLPSGLLAMVCDAIER